VTVLTLGDQAARERIDGALDETLFVEAGAGSGKTTKLVDRVRALVDAGVPLRHVAAITFTEKAAAELRARLRAAFEARAGDARSREALAQLDGAAIGTLHAFAQRLLSERPIEARLPPDVEVLDEVASQLAGQDRWGRLRDRLLEEPALERTLLLGLAAGLRLEDVRAVVAAFDANWDLLQEPDVVPWGREEPPRVDVAPVLAALDEVVADGAACRDAGDTMAVRLGELAAYAEVLRDAPDEYEVLALLAEDRPSFRAGNCGRAPNWPPGALPALRDGISLLGEQRDALRDAVAESCVRRLAVEARDAVLTAAEERRVAGRLSFHDLLVLARDLLRGSQGGEARRDFRDRYRHLLLDEFQDTDPIQVELAVLLASPQAAAGTQPWDRTDVDPGRLFFVGDPKQSIYRFRRADIALFLAARRAFSGDAPVRLTTNFRTTPPLLAWVNHVFGDLIRPVEGSQPEYQPLEPDPRRGEPPVGPAVTVLGADAHDDGPTADQLREREAADVAATVVTALAEGWSVVERRAGPGHPETWRPARPGDIAVLLPARTSLPSLEQALEARGIPYRAETTSLVYATPEVRDLFAALRAVADPTDAHSLVTALRSPLFACGDDDLATWRLEHRGSWSVWAPCPEGAEDHSVAVALGALRGLAEEARWVAPSQLLDRLCRERRTFELGFVHGRPRDVWRRLRFVIDQAREWEESDGGTLREYLAWAALQASESTRVAETVLPETDDDAVRILTVHAAKGLEFPITILSGTSSAAGGRRSRVRVSFPPEGAVGLKVGKAVATAEFEAFEPIDQQLDHHERLRLLYVACTRAKDHLVVSLHRKPRKSVPEHPRSYSSAELLARAAEGASHQTALVHGDTVMPAVALRTATAPAPPPFEEWRAELDGVLARSSRPRTVAATGVARFAGAPEDGVGTPPDGDHGGDAAGDHGSDAAGDHGADPAADVVGPDGMTPPLPLDGPAAASERERERDRERAAAASARGRDREAEPVPLDRVTATITPDDPGLAKGPRDLDLPPWQRGRYGTAVGRAVHAVLQTVDLATGAGLEDAVAAQAAAEGVTGREEAVAALARAALAAPAVRAALDWPRWRETYVAAPVGDTTLEGYVDLLYRTDDGLVIVDYKTAGAGVDLDRRAAGYRLQAAAYALALGTAVGERVARCVFVFLTPQGAVEHAVDDLDTAVTEVRRLLSDPTAPLGPRPDSGDPSPT